MAQSRIERQTLLPVAWIVVGGVLVGSGLDYFVVGWNADQWAATIAVIAVVIAAFAAASNRVAAEHARYAVIPTRAQAVPVIVIEWVDVSADDRDVFVARVKNAGLGPGNLAHLTLEVGGEHLQGTSATRILAPSWSTLTTFAKGSHRAASIKAQHAAKDVHVTGAVEMPAPEGHEVLYGPPIDSMLTWNDRAKTGSNTTVARWTPKGA